jgi:hypothetical protein
VEQGREAAEASLVESLGAWASLIGYTRVHCIASVSKNINKTVKVNAKDSKLVFDMTNEANNAELGSDVDGMHYFTSRKYI